MSTSNANEPAFPQYHLPPGDQVAPGLTKREWLAGMAMQGLLACNACYQGNEDAGRLCEDAVRHADAILSALAADTEAAK